MVVIRLARGGVKRKPFYRITVADSRRWRNGKYIEVLGYYNPVPAGEAKQLEFDVAKAKEWIRKGAQPSERVQKLMKLAENSPN